MTHSSTAANASKFLTFALGEEHYGIAILRVREIIGLVPVTPLPKAPQHVRGVMNLRGRILPVLDLRSRFGLPPVAETKETCIIVVDAGLGDADSSIRGVVVDRVSEVQDVPATSIAPPPAFGAGVPLAFIEGVGRTRDKVILLLDVAEVLGLVGPSDDTAQPTEADTRRAA
jgi:purine-binding chemotaxis protein CheW